MSIKQRNRNRGGAAGQPRFSGSSDPHCWGQSGIHHASCDGMLENEQFLLCVDVGLTNWLIIQAMDRLRSVLLLDFPVTSPPRLKIATLFRDCH